MFLQKHNQDQELINPYTLLITLDFQYTKERLLLYVVF